MRIKSQSCADPGIFIAEGGGDGQREGCTDPTDRKCMYFFLKQVRSKLNYRFELCPGTFTIEYASKERTPYPFSYDSDQTVYMSILIAPVQQALTRDLVSGIFIHSKCLFTSCL